MRVLVTGGTGLVGRAIQNIRPDWIFLGSKDCNLNDRVAIKALLTREQPDVVIHLAANVGGLFKNENQRLEMFQSNLLLNQNVLDCAFEVGIKRVLCCLSTCVFPDGLNRIMTEDDLHAGEPHHSNFGYAYAKRIMEVQCRLFNETPGFNYQCIIPTNIYGPHDNFHLEDAHVIPALIHKAFLCDGETLTIMGTGTPKRQFIYSGDLARIFVRLVEEDMLDPKIICSPPANQEVTILEVAQNIAREFGIPEVVPLQKEEPTQDGQPIKTVTPALLLSRLGDDFQFTPLEQGIRETVEWFKKNYPHVRGAPI
jgi:GDP-L-fucose synthase